MPELWTIPVVVAELYVVVAGADPTGCGCGRRTTPVLACGCALLPTLTAVRGGE